ncbi:MAG: FHA domain-containing protein [Acidobacteria bacterium]|nr:FHA domain-containing protein [Acidobacteriota bacterium]
MKQISVFVLFFLMSWTSAVYGQQPGGNLRLFLEPGIQELPGDGDTTTTITITLRNNEGELVNKSGTVQLKLNAGRLVPARVKLKNGIGQATFTAPILDNENKVFQRSIRLTMAIIQQLKGKSVSELTGKHAYEMNMKTARNVATGMASASGMTSIQGKTPTVHIIGEINGLRGKCAIRILKVNGPVSAGLRPGIYAGRDVTGSSRWKLTVRRGGPGYIGTIRTGGGEMSFRSKGEKKGGFLIVYLFDQRDMRATKNSSFLGWPTLMKVLPGNALYIAAPPVYLTRKGDIPEEGYGTEERPEETEKVSLIVKQNILPGDGKSETQITFIYRNKKGRPKPGIPVRLQIGQNQMGGSLIQPNGRTDSRGIFRCRYRAPLFKTNNFQKLGTCKQDIVWAYYRDGRKEKYVTSKVGILCCTDAFLKVSKIGFDEKQKLPVVVASPRGEFSGKLEARIHNWISPAYLEPVAFAGVKLDGGALSGHSSLFRTETAKDGSFKIHMNYKNWPYFWNYRKKKPYRVRFSGSHVKRRDSLGKSLMAFTDLRFRFRASGALNRMESRICRAPVPEARQIEWKFQLLGDLMAVYNMSEKLVADTTGEIISHGWGLLGMLWDFANKKFKFTKILDRRLKQANDKLEGKLKLRNEAGKSSMPRFIFEKLKSILMRNQPKGMGKHVVILMQHTNAKIFDQLKGLLASVADSLAKVKKWELNPVPGLITDSVKINFRKQSQMQLEVFLRTPLHLSEDEFNRLQHFLVNKSGRLRLYYEGIATGRRISEETKAWKDLAVDLSQALAVGLAAGTGQIWALRAWEKLKKMSDILDKMYEGSGFVLEIWNVATLEADCIEMFRITNSRLGARPASAAFSNAKSLFRPVYADEARGKRVSPPPALSVTDAASLELNSGAIPVESLAIFIEKWENRQAWANKNENILWLGGAEGNSAVKMLRARDEISSALTELKILTAFSNGFLGDPKSRGCWENAVSKIDDNLNRLDSTTLETFQKGLRIQKQLTDETGKKISLPGRRRSTGWHWLILTGIVFTGAGGLLLLIAVRKKNRASRGFDTGSPAGGNRINPRLLIPGGEEVALEKKMTVGSAPDNAIVLPYAGVLPRHAVLYRADNGNWWVESAAAGNSIDVNGRTGHSFWLSHGSRIRLGSAELIFMLS